MASSENGCFILFGFTKKRHSWRHQTLIFGLFLNNRELFVVYKNQPFFQKVVFVENPFFVYQSFKTFKCSVVGIQDNLYEASQ